MPTEIRFRDDDWNSSTGTRTRNKDHEKDLINFFRRSNCDYSSDPSSCGIPRCLQKLRSVAAESDYHRGTSGCVAGGQARRSCREQEQSRVPEKELRDRPTYRADEKRTARGSSGT